MTDVISSNTLYHEIHGVGVSEHEEKFIFISPLQPPLTPSSMKKQEIPRGRGEALFRFKKRSESRS